MRGICPPASHDRLWVFSIREFGETFAAPAHASRKSDSSWGAARHDRASSATVEPEHPARHLLMTCVSPNRIQLFPHDALSERASVDMDTSLKVSTRPQLSECKIRSGEPNAQKKKRYVEPHGHLYVSVERLAIRIR